MPPSQTTPSAPPPLRRLAPRGVLVVGASGFIGSRLVRSLAADPGIGQVRAADLRAPQTPLPAGVDFQIWDVRGPAPAGLADGLDLIVNLAAVHRTPGHPPEAYYETNIAGAQNTCELAEAAQVPALAFTSSISVYGSGERVMDESTPPDPGTHYGRSKLLAEQCYRAWGRRRPGRKLVIVRPAVVFGPGEQGNYTRLAAALRGGYFVYPGRRDTVKSGGSVDELIRSLRFALQHPDPEILYNFAFPEPPTTEAIVQALCAVTGWRARPPAIPLPLLMAIGAAGEVFDRLGWSNPFHRDRIRKLVESTRVDPGWLRAQGFQFHEDLTVALAKWRDESDGRFV